MTPNFFHSNCGERSFSCPAWPAVGYMQSGPNGHQPRETAGHKKISKAIRNIPGKKLATFQENPGRKVLLNFEGGGHFRTWENQILHWVSLVGNFEIAACSFYKQIFPKTIYIAFRWPGGQMTSFDLLAWFVYLCSYTLEITWGLRSFRGKVRSFCGQVNWNAYM